MVEKVGSRHFKARAHPWEKLIKVHDHLYTQRPDWFGGSGLIGLHIACEIDDLVADSNPACASFDDGLIDVFAKAVVHALCHRRTLGRIVTYPGITG